MTYNVLAGQRNHALTALRKRVEAYSTGVKEVEKGKDITTVSGVHPDGLLEVSRESSWRYGVSPPAVMWIKDGEHGKRRQILRGGDVEGVVPT